VKAERLQWTFLIFLMLMAVVLLFFACIGCVYVGAGGSYHRTESVEQQGTNNRANRIDFMTPE
jgi:hypothetical protein